MARGQDPERLLIDGFNTPQGRRRDRRRRTLQRRGEALRILDKLKQELRPVFLWFRSTS